MHRVEPQDVHRVKQRLSKCAPAVRRLFPESRQVAQEVGRLRRVEPFVFCPTPRALLGLVESRHFSFEADRVAMPAIGGQNVGALALDSGQKTKGSIRSVDLLFYSALFLSDGHAELANAIRRAASRGTRVRILVGNPRSTAVIARGREEGIGHDVASRVRMTLHYLDGVDQVDGVQVRGHSTTLYNSIYRFDDDMLVNAHTYGAAAVESPVLHLRRVPRGRLFDHYMKSFERVWAASAPIPSSLAREETNGSCRLS